MSAGKGPSNPSISTELQGQGLATSGAFAKPVCKVERLRNRRCDAGVEISPEDEIFSIRADRKHAMIEVHLYPFGLFSDPWLTREHSDCR
jgi:hypothetical protein